MGVNVQRISVALRRAAAVKKDVTVLREWRVCAGTLLWTEAKKRLPATWIKALGCKQEAQMT